MYVFNANKIVWLSLIGDAILHRGTVHTMIIDVRVHDVCSDEGGRTVPCVFSDE